MTEWKWQGDDLPAGSASSPVAGTGDTALIIPAGSAVDIDPTDPRTRMTLTTDADYRNIVQLLNLSDQPRVTGRFYFVCPPFPVLFSDAFTTQDAGVWTGFSGTDSLVTGSYLQIRYMDDALVVDSISNFDLTSRHVAAQLFHDNSHPSNETWFGFGDNGPLFGNNQLMFVVVGTTLFLRSIVGGGAPNDTTVPFDVDTMHWLRVREEAGSIFWETSPEGLTWTTQRTLANPFAITARRIKFGAFNFTGDQAQYALFDTVRLKPNAGLSNSLMVGTSTTATFWRIDLSGLLQPRFRYGAGASFVESSSALIQGVLYRCAFDVRNDGADLRFFEGDNISSPVATVSHTGTPAATDDLYIGPDVLSSAGSGNFLPLHIGGLLFNNTGIDPGPIVIVVPPDPTPGVPSTPIPSSRLGIVKVVWDGLDQTGSLMPSDLRYVEVHTDTSSGYIPTSVTLRDVIVSPSGGSATITGLAYGSTQYVQLVAVSTSGDRTASSTEVSIVVDMVVGDDIAVNSIEANKIAAGELEADIVLADGSISTGVSGARVVITDAGLRAFDSGNVQQVSILPGESGKLIVGDPAAQCIHLGLAVVGVNTFAMVTFFPQTMDYVTGGSPASVYNREQLSGSRLFQYVLMDSGSAKEFGITGEGDVARVFCVSGLSNDSSVAYVLVDANHIQSPRLRLDATDEASASSSQHALGVGPASGVNWVADGGEIQARNNGSVAPFEINPHGGGVSILDMRPLQIGPLTSQTTTSTSYVTLNSSDLSGTFPYPPSGQVEVEVQSESGVSAAGAALMSFEIRDTNVSGTVRSAAADSEALVSRLTTGTNHSKLSTPFIVTGLPTSGTGYVRAMYKSSSGAVTATFSARTLLVRPSI